MYQVGLIGYGAFGQALEKWLASYCEFTIYDPKSHPENLAEALARPVIVLALPAQHLAEFLKSSQQLNPSALYIDVCSVKVKPAEEMQRYLPRAANIIATHPLFGPSSAPDSVAGQKIMVHKVRSGAAAYEEFKKFLKALELKIIETTPQKHDQAMAYVQGLSHYIGRIMQEMNIPDSPLATRAYQDLLDMKEVQGKDSDELFYSIVKSNPYAKRVLARFEKARRIVDKKLD